MDLRGVTDAEIQETLGSGWPCSDPQPGRDCRMIVFDFASTWDGRWYLEKEVTVYYTFEEGTTILITVKVRYGSGFPRE